MQIPELVDLAFVDANEAVRRHFEALNYRRSRLLWGIYLGISFGAFVGGLSSDDWVVGWAGGLSMSLLLGLVLARRRASFRSGFGSLLLVLLAGQNLLWMLLASDVGLATSIGCALVPMVLLLLRLRVPEVLTLVVVAVGGMTLRMLGLPGFEEENAEAGSVIAVAVLGVLAGVIAIVVTARARRSFLERWRASSGRERERQRMREELHGARAIQLAMLPTTAPQLPALEVAASCVPASEVGGDYYDYFPAADGPLTVAIGDVAGHGMASGLVVAGVRAGLHLLADEAAAAPVRVLERLNALVARPSGQRLPMTLGLATFDPAAGRATWTSAGHPPPLCYTPATGVDELPTYGHPPLGTRLPLAPRTVERPWSAGDVWLLISDGALEVHDDAGNELGCSGLAALLARHAGDGGGADQILAGLLAALTRYRGERAPEDDITLVVVRAAPKEPTTDVESAG